MQTDQINSQKPQKYTILGIDVVKSMGDNFNFLQNKYQIQASTNISKDQLNSLQAQIQAQSYRHCQAYKSKQNQIKTNVHYIISTLSKSDCTVQKSNIQFQSNILTYSKVQQSTRQSIDNITKTIQQNKKSPQFQKSNTNQLKEKQKLFILLNEQLQQDNFKLIKTLFSYYYGAYTKTQVMIRNLISQQKNEQNDQIFYKNYHSRDNQKILHKISYVDIMYPPVVCQNDYRYHYDFLTTNSSFELSKSKDIYQTEKPKDLIKCQIRIIDLVTIIRKLVQVNKQQEDIINNLIHDLKGQVSSQIRGGKFNFMPYETESVLLLMCDYVNAKLTNTQVRPNIQYLLLSKEQGQKMIEKQQKLKINQNLSYKILSHSLQFLQKLSFYNFVISCFTFFNKIDVPVKIYLGLNQQKLNNLSFTDIKIALFTKTINNPSLLMRLFKQSVGYKISGSISKTFSKCEFNMSQFYDNICPIQNQLQLIKLYIKYQLHLMIYSNEIVYEMAQRQILILREVLNYKRLLVLIFICHFILKTLKVIDNQIRTTHHKQFYKRFLEKRSKDQKWNLSYNRIITKINQQFTKILSYLNPVNQKQISASTKGIKQQPKDLINFLKKISNDHKQRVTKSITEQKQQIKKIYSYTTDILKKSFLSRQVFQNYYKRISKDLGVNYPFSAFVEQDNPHSNHIQQIHSHLMEKKLNILLRQFKTGQIQMLKLYNMFRVMFLYSFTNQLEQIKTAELQNYAKPKHYNQLLGKMDLMFMDTIKKKRICTSVLIDPNMSDESLNGIFDSQYYFSKLVDQLFVDNAPNINENYLKDCLNYQNYSLKNSMFIPTKSWQSFIQQQQFINKKFKKKQMSPQKVQIEQYSNETTAASTRVNQNTKESQYYSEHQKQQKNNQQFVQNKTSCYQKDIKTHPYSELIINKQNLGINYNFDLNKIIHGHIHKNRLSIFNIKQTKHFMNLISQNLYLPDLQKKESRLNFYERLSKFVGITLNKSVIDFIRRKQSPNKIKIVVTNIQNKQQLIEQSSLSIISQQQEKNDTLQKE